MRPLGPGRADMSLRLWCGSRTAMKKVGTDAFAQYCIVFRLEVVGQLGKLRAGC